MSAGPGRFVDLTKIPGLMDVLNNTMGLTPGLHDLVGRNNRDAVFDVAPRANPKRDGSHVTQLLSNYTTGVWSDDFLTRAYVFGSSALQVSGGTVYVDANGKVEIRGLQIRPLDDNFNFEIAEKKPYVQAYNRAWQFFNDRLRKIQRCRIRIQRRWSKKIRPNYQREHRKLRPTQRASLLSRHSRRRGCERESGYSPRACKWIPKPIRVREEGRFRFHQRRRHGGRQASRIEPSRSFGGRLFDGCRGRDFVKFSAIGRSFR